MRPLLAQTRFELLLTLRRGESILVTVLVPILLLIFFGTVAVFDANPRDQLRQLMPGLMALAVMSTGMVSLGIGTGFERQYGFLKRLGASPLTRPQLLAAKGIVTLGVVAAQIGLLCGVAFLLFGWRAELQPWMALAIILLGLAAFAGLGLLMAGTLPAEATLALANTLYLVFLLLGGLVVPLDRLPAGIHAVARLLPGAALADLLAGSVGDWGQVWRYSLPVLLAWSVLTPLAAVRWFRWE